MMTDSRYSIDEGTFQKSCFCQPWKKPFVSSEVPDHTDADLAADMNALTFEQRQAIEADIHGVSDVIEETPDFVKDNIIQVREAVMRLSPRQRQAWDRAVFLRPSLSEDERLYLMCLRARHFRPDDAASLLAAYFRSKLDLFGEELLIHRITWNDLTEHEQKIFRSGAYQFLPNYDRAGRAVIVSRLSRWDLSDYKALARCMWYTDSITEDDPNIQRKGVVTVVDGADAWKYSPIQALHFMTVYPLDSTPFHEVSMHGLYNDTTMDAVIRRFRRILPNDHRMRLRLHFGSTIETIYSLRAFGIDVSHQLSASQRDGNDDSLIPFDGIEESIKKRQQLDEEWRRSEAPYRDPNSVMALFPNPQDVIMGRNRLIAWVWSGNVMYQGVVQQYVPRYAALLSSGGTDRIEKTLISVEIHHLLRKKYNSTFLERKDDTWVVVDDAEVQTKIGVYLRKLVRISTGKKNV